MAFALTFDTDNDAFADDDATEVARILRKLADRVLAGTRDEDESGAVLDCNGNKIGEWSFTHPWLYHADL